MSSLKETISQFYDRNNKLDRQLIGLKLDLDKHVQ